MPGPRPCKNKLDKQRTAHPHTRPPKNDENQAACFTSPEKPCLVNHSKSANPSTLNRRRKKTLDHDPKLKPPRQSNPSKPGTKKPVPQTSSYPCHTWATGTLTKPWTSKTQTQKNKPNHANRATLSAAALELKRPCRQSWQTSSAVAPFGFRV